MRISDWSSDVCSSDLSHRAALRLRREAALRALEFFIGFDARLVGPVLDGTADANSPVTLQLYTDDADAVPRFLDEHRIPADARESHLRLDRTREDDFPVWRSEERRVGTECGRTGRSRGW